MIIYYVAFKLISQIKTRQNIYVTQVCSLLAINTQKYKLNRKREMQTFLTQILNISRAG